jgi:type VI secretion system protein ImpA
MKDRPQQPTANFVAPALPEQATPVEPAATPARGAAENINRQQAIQAIQASAHYFRQAEPHSPISYLLDKALHWSTLSLPELLQELIHDEQIKQHVFHLTGIHQPH